jgi:photosystem II stability/assembly factor-like uncharacterized protein
VSHLRPQVGAAGDESHELMDGIQQWNNERLAPSGSLYDGAYTGAFGDFTAMGVTPASYTEVTTLPYNADDLNYSDRYWSNSGGGAGYVTGRMTALAFDEAHHVLYAAAAGGGVWKSGDDGGTWTPIGDRLPSLSIGALAVNQANGDLWVGTGEGNTNSDAYSGSGVYRLPYGGGTLSLANRVGGTNLDNHTVRNLRIAGTSVFAATNRGVYRTDLSGTSGWTPVLVPCDGVGTAPISCSGGDTYKNIANDLAVKPGTDGHYLVAAMGWRGGSGGSTAYNGFYYSSDGGDTWTRANPTGAINPHEIGNATLAYSNDGKKLYVVMESPTLLLKGASSVLAGVYVSNSGNIAGPYSQIATSQSLAQTGSAMKRTVIGPGYQPGVQAWYNQFIGVDPTDPNHVYLGLEEVYESHDGGKTWATVGRYWDFGLGCFSYTDSTCDGNVMHSDQHAITFGDGNVFVGNDGGLYGRSTTQRVGWNNLNSSGTIDTLQYYAADVGPAAGGGVDVWGGLQDNGQSLLRPGLDHMVSPVGGDGGDQLVDKTNGCNTLGEYVYLEMQVTIDCGENDNSSKQTVFSVGPGDPNPRFISPFEPAVNDPGYWVAGGQYVWDNKQTFASRDGNAWDMVGDTGDWTSGVLHSATAVTAMKLPDESHVVYAGWCKGACAPDGFERGIATNAGTGVWHQAADHGLPVRYIGAITVDPSDSSGKTAYAVLSGYSRKWQSGPGGAEAGQGHVYMTKNGGDNWTGIDGSTFPDVPANDVRLLSDGRLVVATDLGVVIGSESGGTWTWTRLGTALPFVPVTSLAFLGGQMYVATHGRGVWSTPLGVGLAGS